MSDNKRSGVEIRLDLPYGGGPAGNLCVDVYLPAGAEMHPALLCLHGGAWLRGSKSQYKSWAPWLAERGYDRLYGARPLARVIQEYIKKPLADDVLFGRLKNGGHVRVIVKKDEVGRDTLGFAVYLFYRPAPR